MSTATGEESAQSIWLDDISRGRLADGTIARYVDTWHVTGLTSNPTIYDHAIRGSDAYDEAIRAALRGGRTGEDLFFDLAIEDIAAAADLFLPVWNRTSGTDGWVSLEVSPLLAHDGGATLAAAKDLRSRIKRTNAMIKIPGTPAGLVAVEEAIFAGIPVNVTLLFSREHYLAAAEAYLKGIERRIAAGLSPDVRSVASLFVSRWDTAVRGRIPRALEDRLGIAIGQRVYRAYWDLLASARWTNLLERGARPQRLLFASTGTKSPGASELLYVEALNLPRTVITMPENTLRALVQRGPAAAPKVGLRGDFEGVLSRFRDSGIDVQSVASQLQTQGTAAFAKSWSDLMAVLAAKGAKLATPH